MTRIGLLDIVALTQDIPDENVQRGQVGTVVEVFASDAFEVEFINREEYTYAMRTLHTDQIMLLHYEPVHTFTA